jgi:hypothetical protein
MHESTYTYDGSGIYSGGTITTYTYVGGSLCGQQDSATEEDGRAVSLTEEQRALLALVGEAAHLLKLHYQRACRQLDRKPADWPEVKASTEALLLRLADQFRDCAGDLPPSPDVVVKPPPEGGLGSSEPAA